MERRSTTSFTIDIDTGGTFTDAYVAGPHGGIQVKADTTPHDLRVGIMDCIGRAAERLGTTRRDLLASTDTVRLSTTLGTNALIAGTGSRVGLLLSDSLYEEDLARRLPEEVPLQRELIAPVADGAGADHDSPSAMDQVKHLLERGARIIVVALDGDDLAAAENALREQIAEEHPRHYLGTVPVLPSHQVSRTPDAASRVRTAVVNAYLHPLMARFLYRVEDELRREGYARPLLIANADGGSSRVAKTTAIRTWGSGPAGAVAGAAHLATVLGSRVLLTLDVGGTSTDISVVGPGAWRYVVEPTIGGARVAVPLLELESVGVGGGSVVRVAGDSVTVGPESAGGQPGPAAYGLGGEDATLTDAFCCAGVFDPANFLGGRKKLDVEAAEQVFERVAAALGESVTMAVNQTIRVAAQEIAARVGELLRERDHDPADVELLVAGGAGGLLGCHIAAAVGLAAVRALPMTPVFSAYGLSVLDRMHSYELAGDADGLAARLDAALQRARSDMRTEGVDPSTLRFELEIEAGPDGAVVARSLGDVGDGSEAAELVAGAADAARLVRLRAIASSPASPPPEIGAGGTTAAWPGPRSVSWGREPEETNVFPWASLKSGETIAGPAIVENEHTTFLVPPAFTASVGRYGDLLIRSADAGA